MTTAVDTNVIIALWDRDKAVSTAAQLALEAALRRGGLVVAAPVFAELLAAPGRNEAFLDAFFRDTGITVDWNLDEAVWRSVGQAFQKYATHRGMRRDTGPRRILADFLIGAHALRRSCSLLTFDDRLYRGAFPDLRIAEA